VVVHDHHGGRLTASLRWSDGTSLAIPGHRVHQGLP
jgi:hypothetical protein